MGLTYQMELILNITSYHRLSPEIEASKKIQENLIFGRSESCDWHLPDPEKIISSKHGNIKKEGDAFYLYDNSTNGIFVNFAVAPLGEGNKHRLANEDVLTVGDFQISVKLEELQSSFANDVPAYSKPDFESSRVQDKPVKSFSQPQDFLNESILDESMPEISMVQESFSNSVDQIPEDWDDLSSLMNSDPAPEIISAPEIAPTPRVESVQPPKVSSPNKVVSNKQKTNSTPKIVKQGSSNLSEAFLKGLGVNQELQNTLDDEELWFEMGQSLNLLLTGVMESLRQRATVKSQLRLNHTMFQTKQNNPLKFSASIDDVIQNLFIRNSASFLNSEESIKESFADTRKHEHALIAGATGTLKGLLEQLSPTHINQQATDTTSVLRIIPGQIEAKSWKLYQQLHNDLYQEINSKGAMAMSDDFLKAYNDKVKEID